MILNIMESRNVWNCLCPLPLFRLKPIKDIIIDAFSLYEDVWYKSDIVNINNIDKDLLDDPIFSSFINCVSTAEYTYYSTESMKKVCEILLKENLYECIFLESMSRYEKKEEFDMALYKEVCDTTLDEIKSMLNLWLNEEFDLQRFKELILLLRWDFLMFKLWKWSVIIEKTYFYWDTAKYINRDLWNKDILAPRVYAYNLHVHEWANINKIGLAIENIKKFTDMIDLKAYPYLHMKSWLLDINFRRFVLKQKNRSEDKINEYIASIVDQFYWYLIWWLTMEDPSNVFAYKSLTSAIKFIRNFEEILDEYEKSGCRLCQWEGIISLNKVQLK